MNEIRKIVVNRCFGGFGISKKACKHMGLDCNASHWDIKRDSSKLVAAVEALGDDASAQLAELKIVEIPADVEWEIDDYDGMESVHEKHRSW